MALVEMTLTDTKLCKVTPKDLKYIPDILPERGRIEYPAELELNKAEIRRCMSFAVVEDVAAGAVLNETDYYLIEKEETSEEPIDPETPSEGEGTEDEEAPSLFGTVSTYTGGTVNNNGTANVEVLVEETTLEFVEANELRAEGWWVGIRVDAPEGLADNATYRSKSNPTAEYGEAKNFADMKDGDTHIGLWFPVSAESIEKFASENRNLTITYAFDWNGDGVDDQVIAFSVAPSEKIVLMKNGEQVYPVVTE